jgi:hypothetical protein
MQPQKAGKINRRFREGREMNPFEIMLAEAAQFPVTVPCEAA